MSVLRTQPSRESSEPPSTFTPAQREYERHKATDEARTRAKWGKLGGLAVALSDEKQSTKAWSSGAAGEAAVGARLDGLASESIRVMHDRRVPRSKANILSLVVTPGGGWVIDTKRHVGAAPQKRVEGGIIRPRVELLTVKGRDKTALVDGVLKQVGHVRDAGAEGSRRPRAAVGQSDAIAPCRFSGSLLRRGVPRVVFGTPVDPDESVMPGLSHGNDSSDCDRAAGVEAFWASRHDSAFLPVGDWGMHCIGQSSQHLVVLDSSRT